MQLRHFTLEEIKGYTVCTFDHAESKVNKLSRSVFDELEIMIEDLEKRNDIKAFIFVSGKPDHMIVGADIDEFDSSTSASEIEKSCLDGHQLMMRFEKLPFKTLIAIHGNCLGGGLELALCFKHRLASDDNLTKLGLPEVKLGLIPGLGGCQRLPRLVGIQASLDIILTGKNVFPKKAKKIGLVDQLVPKEQLLERAIEFLENKASKKADKSFQDKLKDTLLEKNPLGLKVLKDQSLKAVRSKSRGLYPAPEKAIEVIVDGFGLSLKDALALEAKAFSEVFSTSESHSLIHLFRTTQKLKANEYAKKGRDYSSKNVGIIGGGFMGSGIASVLSMKDVPVHIKEVNQDGIGRSLGSVETVYKEFVKKRRIQKHEKNNKMGLISPCLDYRYLANTDIVIEAVFEDIELKKKVAADTAAVVSDDCIYASNTSSLPISDIAKAYKHPEKVLGMHFFSPVHKMPLVELIETDQTDPEVTAKAFALSKLMGKEVIVVKDKVGFYTTRCLGFLFNEVGWLLHEGCPVEHLDKAMLDAGFPVGPCTLLDEVGIDVGEKVAKILLDAFGDVVQTPLDFEKIRNSGRQGRKNKKGLYTYSGKKKEVDTEFYSLIDNPEAGKNKIEISQIQDRGIFRFINEAILCLQEGVLKDPYSGDLGAVFGLGFPPFRGGPFKMADAIGVKAVYDKISKLEQEHGARFKPADLLVEHARANKAFYN